MCQGEAPAVARFARTHPKILVIALSSRWAQPADVTRFARRYLERSPVRLARDPSGAIARSYHIETHPHVRILSRGGGIIGDAVGLEQALAQAGLG
jgi:hypothetical protein